MFKCEIDEDAVIQMCDMKPLQIAKVVSNNDYYGDIVMRTASSIDFEVMNLSDPGEGRCWPGDSTLKVTPLKSGTKITLTVE